MRAVEGADSTAKPARKRQHKPTLASVKKQADKAGIEVARYEFEPGGKIAVVPGKAGPGTSATEHNEWDEVLDGAASQVH